MKKGILSMEEFGAGDSNLIKEDHDAAFSNEMAPVELAHNQVQQQEDVVSEAQGISSTLNAVRTEVSDSLETGGLDDKNARLIEVAVEHFCHRLSYAKTVVPAMEGFKGTATRLEQSRATLKNLDEMAVKLEKGVIVAQEGLIDSIGASISVAFETQEKIKARLLTASADYDQKGPKEAMINEPGWGKYFSVHGTMIEPSAAVAYIKEINQATHSANLQNTVKTLGDCFERMTSVVKDVWFVSNKHDIDTIDKIAADMEEAIGAFDNDFKATEAVHYKNFKPLDTASKKKLVDEVQKLLENSDFDKVAQELKKQKDRMNRWVLFNHMLRFKSMLAGTLTSVALAAIAGGLGFAFTPFMATINNFMGRYTWGAEDLLKANKAKVNSLKAINTISDLAKSRLAVCSAAASYIQASTR